MEFRNLTPFSVMRYKMLNKADHALHVVVMKAGFRLVKTSDGRCEAHILDQQPLPLCIQDTYLGELNRSPVVQESDLAPFKPACDVIINATGYAPAGKPCTAFPVNVRLSTPAGESLLDKTLLLTGERQFVRQFTGEWLLSDPQLFTSLPVDYRFAFGGEGIVYPEDEGVAGRVEQKYRLNEAQRAAHPEQEHLPVAHHVCVSNPHGCGYTEPWYLHATRKTALPAPRILSVSCSLQDTDFESLAQGTADLRAPQYQPAGFGIIGRSWQSRLSKAGTYDPHWLETRHPYLPEDFDFGYWNGAPQDQQIPFPTSAIRVELTNLTPDGHLSVTLPHHQALVLLRLENGKILPQPMLMDTLLVDLDSMTIAQTWRYVADTDMPLRVMETRYEVEPGALATNLFPYREKARG